MKLQRILFLFIIFSILVLLALSLFISNLRLSLPPINSIANNIIARIQQQTGIVIKINRITTNIIDSVYISDINIYKTDNLLTAPVITAPDLIVKYSFWDIIFKPKQSQDNLTEISIENASFVLDDIWINSLSKLNIQPNISDTKIKSLPRLKLNSCKIKYFISKNNKELLFQDVNSVFNLKNSMLNLKIITKQSDEKSLPMSLQATFDISGSTITGLAVGKNLDLYYLNNYFQILRLESIKNINFGKTGFNLKTSFPKDIKNITQLNINGKINFQDGQINISSSTAITKIYCDLLCDNNIINLSKFSGKFGNTIFSSSGKVTQIFTKPYFKLNFQIDSGEINDILDIIPIRIATHWSGNFKSNLSLEGTTTYYKGTAEFSSDSITSKLLTFSNSNIKLTISPDEIQVNSAETFIDKSKISLEGKIIKFDNLQLQALIRNIKTTSVDKILKITLPQALLNAKFDITETIKHPKIKGNYTLLTTESEQSKGNEIISRGNFDCIPDQYLNIAGQITSYDCQFQVNLKKDKLSDLILIKQTSLSLPTQGKISIDGNISSSKNIDLTIKSDRLILQTLPLLKDKYKYLFGELFLNGKISGIFDQPTIKITVIGKENNCGSFTGNIDLEYLNSNPILNIQLRTKNDQWQNVYKNNLTFDTVLSTDTWQVKQLSITQPQGNLYLTLSSQNIPKSDTVKKLVVTGKFDNYKIETAKINADFNLQGSIDVNNNIVTTLNSQNLEINNYSYNPLNGRIEYISNILKIKDLTYGDKIKVELTINYDLENVPIIGKINVVDTPILFLESFLPKEYNKTINGILNSSINISGNLKNPIVKIDSDLKDGKYKTIDFNSQGKTAISKNVLDTKFTFEPKSGNTTIIQGQLTILPKNEFHGKFSIDNLSFDKFDFSNLNIDFNHANKTIKINSA